jgi:hypothetical protein
MDKRNDCRGFGGHLCDWLTDKAWPMIVLALCFALVVAREAKIWGFW